MAGSAKRRRTTLVSKGGPGQAVAGELASKRHRARNGKAAAEVSQDIRHGEDPLTAIAKRRKGAQVAAKKASPGKRVKGQTKTG
jgi:hypothetical protein